MTCMIQESDRFTRRRDGSGFERNLENWEVWGAGNSLVAVIMPRFCTVLYWSPNRLRIIYAKEFHALMTSRSSAWVSSVYTPCS